MGSNDLTHGTVWKKLLGFFFPVLFGLLFQQLYNTVDAVIVGRYVGTEALAAVGGSAAMLINLVVGFFLGAASGTSVLISHAFGARDADRMQKTVHTALTLSLIIGAVLTALGILLARPALKLVRNPEDIMDSSSEYLRIYFTGIIPLLLFNVGSGILRAVGDSRRPLFFLVVSCAVNILLDVLFVAVLKLGVAGVGWATVIAQAVSAVLVLITLARTSDSWKFRPTALGVNHPVLRDTLRIGVPVGVQSAMYSVSNLIVQAAVNALGTTFVASWTAITKFDGFYWVMSGAFSATIIAFVGQCWGASKITRMKQGIRTCLFLHIGFTIVTAGLMLLLVRPFMELLSDDPEVIGNVTKMVLYFAPFYWIWSFIEIIAGALEGVGDSLPPMIITVIGVCVLRILWVLFIVPLAEGFALICLCYPATWLVTAVSMILYYKSTGNKRKKPELSEKA